MPFHLLRFIGVAISGIGNLIALIQWCWLHRRNKQTKVRKATLMMLQDMLREHPQNVRVRIIMVHGKIFSTKAYDVTIPDVTEGWSRPTTLCFCAKEFLPNGYYTYYGLENCLIFDLLLLSSSEPVDPAALQAATVTNVSIPIQIEEKEIKRHKKQKEKQHKKKLKLAAARAT